MNYGWRFLTLYRRQGARPSPRKRKIKQLNAEDQGIARRDKKALNEQCKEIEENNRMGKTRDLFKKIGDPREHFMQRWAQ